MRILIWLVLAIALVILINSITRSWAGSHNQGDGWRLVGTAGRADYYKFVLIKPNRQRDRKVYDDAIRYLCPSDDYCSILFWSEPKYVPKSMPMTDSQANHEVANYWNNPNGGNQFLWKCAKGDSPDSCFE